MAGELQAQLAASGRDNPCMVGIHTGGVWLAEGLHQRLGLVQRADDDHGSLSFRKALR